MKFATLSRRRKRRGFTLMEVLLVMAILVVIGSLVGVGYMGIRKSNMKRGAKVQIEGFKTALDVYYAEMNTYPQSLEDLRNAPPDATQAKKWKEGGGPYLHEEIPLDPWGQEYKYTGGGQQYRVWSYGPDGNDSTGDEIEAKQNLEG